MTATAMRIGLNLLYLIPGIVGGTETYAAGLLHGLAQLGKRNEFVIFMNKESADWPVPQATNFTSVICAVAAIKRSRRYFFEQVRLNSLLKRYAVDVVHSLGYVGPLWTPCPAVVTVPDLNYIDIGNTLSFRKRYLLRFISIHAAKQAKVIITISNFSKTVICKGLNIPPEKVVVTLLGPHRNDNLVSQDIMSKVKASYGISGPYLVAFAGGALHKNIPRLLQAFAKLKKELSLQLVLIGHLPHNVNSEEFSGDIILTGYVPAEHVVPLLAGAEVFVLPSLYEGFGLPVLEAQQAGVPVVCSTAGSLPEVAGEAAIFFDPYSIKDMTDKIALVACDPDLQAKLRKRGKINVQRYSWERTARETLKVYEKAFRSRGVDNIGLV